MHKEVRAEVQMKCYVCGFALEDYPYHPEVLTANPSVICPSCGMHYGYDDDGAGSIVPDELTSKKWKFGDEDHKRILKFLRDRWIDHGMRWWSPQPVPKNWDPKRQLLNIGIEL